MEKLGCTRHYRKIQVPAIATQTKNCQMTPTVSNRAFMEHKYQAGCLPKAAHIHTAIQMLPGYDGL